MVSADEHSVEELRQYAMAAIRERNLTQAIEYYQQATKQDPADPLLFEGLGVAQSMNHQFDQAIESFKHAVDLNPARSASYINLGAICNRVGEFDEAIRYLQEGIKRDYKSVEAFHNLGIAYRKSGQLDLSLSAYREVMRLKPQDAEAYYNVGKVYRDLNQFQQAITHFRKAMELRSDYPKALEALLDAEKKLNKSKKEISPFGRLVDDVPKKNKDTIIVDGLKPRERREDRDTVSTFATAIEVSGKEFRDELQNNFRQVLDTIRTSLNQGVSQSTSFHNLHQRFRLSARQLAFDREQLMRKVAQLEAHEELILAKLDERA